jgi:hypothetical protein
LYDEWVRRLAAEAAEEHYNSPGEKVRKRMALTYRGVPNPEQLALCRLHLTISPANLTLAQEIYGATCRAWDRSRRQYKDKRLPGGLGTAAGALHVRLLDLAEPPERAKSKEEAEYERRGEAFDECPVIFAERRRPKDKFVLETGAGLRLRPSLFGRQHFSLPRARGKVQDGSHY